MTVRCMALITFSLEDMEDHILSEILIAEVLILQQPKHIFPSTDLNYMTGV